MFFVFRNEILLLSTIATNVFPTSKYILQGLSSSVPKKSMLRICIGIPTDNFEFMETSIMFKPNLSIKSSCFWSLDSSNS